jgi:hypothetical protein
MRFIVVKSTSRSYGYSLKNTGPVLSWITGPGQTFAWYKYKWAAQARANDLNSSLTLKEA